jgi:hypothetical protein
VLGALAVLAVGTGAALATTVTVNRCGYVAKGFYGKDAIYPWHMSCATARRDVAVANDPKAKRITLTADGASTGDADPVLIDGRWWVCGGRMGYYFCGYPYRPARASGVGGGTTWRGPFTEEAAYNACSVAPNACRATDTVYLPSR